MPRLFPLCALALALTLLSCLKAGGKNEAAAGAETGSPPEWRPYSQSAQSADGGRDPENPSAENPGPAHARPGMGKYAAALPGFQQVFADVAEMAIPAVVSVHSEKQAPVDPGSPILPEGTPFHWFFGPQGPHGELNPGRRESGLGSGVMISREGYVLTNNHVVEDADIIRVTLSDEREIGAKLVGADKATDLAVLKLQDDGPFAVATLGNSDDLRIGEWVLAVGSPYGLSQTVTAGIISAKSRRNTGINGYENFLQTDAAINPGNSGGALMNMSGELIGINTAIFSRSGGYQGIGFAIPINMARKIMEDLIRDGEVTRGWLGVSIQPIDQGLAEALGLTGNRGALVGGVVEGSPADKSGIQRGDVLLAIDGNPLRDPSDLLNRVALIRPGSWVALRVYRSGKEATYKAKIVKRDEKRLSRLRDDVPGGNLGSDLGMEIAPVSSLTRERYGLDAKIQAGVVITGITNPTGRAAVGKLREGDVILEINRQKVKDPLQFDDALRQALKGNRVLMLIGRGEGTFYTTL